jgi:uncharacterized protein (DUF1697 family)
MRAEDRRQMPRYAAFLRGVMPTNCKMSALKEAFEAAGFTDVKTFLGSGNVAFEAPKASHVALEKKVEAAIEKGLGRSFLTMIRSIDELRALIATDPFRGVRLKPNSKKIVTFLRNPPKDVKLPIEQDNARVLRVEGNNLFSVYAPTPKGPVFMKLIESVAGKEQTTRTWDTVNKVAAK